MLKSQIISELYMQIYSFKNNSLEIIKIMMEINLLSHTLRFLVCSDSLNDCRLQGVLIIVQPTIPTINISASRHSSIKFHVRNQNFGMLSIAYDRFGIIGLRNSLVASLLLDSIQTQIVISLEQLRDPLDLLLYNQCPAKCTVSVLCVTLQ